jgi:hypothetical protein
MQSQISSQEELSTKVKRVALSAIQARRWVFSEAIGDRLEVR